MDLGRMDLVFSPQTHPSGKHQLRGCRDESSRKIALKRHLADALTVVALEQQATLPLQEYLIHSPHIRHFIFSSSTHPRAARASFYYNRGFQTKPFTRRRLHHARIWRQRRRCWKAGVGGAGVGGMAWRASPPLPLTCRLEAADRDVLSIYGPVNKAFPTHRRLLELIPSRELRQ